MVIAYNETVIKKARQKLGFAVFSEKGCTKNE